MELEDFEVLDLQQPLSNSFRRDVVAGLSAQPKSLPCKYFYDARGSKLFDRICELPEYYLTRAETAVLERHGVQIASWLGKRPAIVEFGSGSSIKTEILLDALEDAAVYVPVDISRRHLLETCARLVSQYPNLPVLPVVGDYTRGISLPPLAKTCHPIVGYFPGSAVGNFDRVESRRFLTRVRRLVGQGGGLLIGFDLVKDVKILEAAYNDSRGVTARFNLNLLRRIGREIGAELSDQFEHLARYNPRQRRIEMYLRSTCRQEIRVGDRTFPLARGELIHTENCHKYTLAQTEEMAIENGFRPAQSWCDQDRLFSVQYWQAR